MRHLATLAGSLLATAHVSAQQSSDYTSRIKYNLNSDWRILVGDPKGAANSSFDDSTWKIFTLPYAWNGDEAFRLDIANLSTGIAWYRKHFQVPASTAGKKLFLEFEGIRHGGSFYLNDLFIGRSENGVMAFGFDISDIVKQDQDNVLSARVDNSWDYKEVATGQKFQWNDRNFYANYGGINKHVYLHVTDRLYQTLPLYSNLQTTGTYVYAQNISISGRTANITVQTEVKNEYNVSKTFNYQVDIQELGGKTITTMSGGSYTLSANQTRIIITSATVDGLNFWSWGYGYLYDVHTTLSSSNQTFDIVKTRTGFRKTDFRSGMFKLNDRILHLKGYAQRTTNEWPSLGCAVPAWLSEFSNKLILESHGSLVRWMHVTPWKQDVESLDRIGLMMAMPAGDSEGDVTGRRWEQRLELMRDAIIYNRNNPSVVFYESGNHGISEDHMADMKKIRDTYDPFGGRVSGSREMLNSTVAEYGGEMLYVNKGKRIPFYAHEYSRDEGLRKYWDNYSPPYHPDGTGASSDADDAGAYNRNQDSHAIENVARWYDYYEQRPGTGDRVNAGGVNIIFSDSNTHHRGAENYRRSGEVDAMRLPKDGWYAHRVMWNTWVDAEVPSTHLIGHWNYNSTTTKDLYVVSTSNKVELVLNGKSLGYGKQSNRFLFTFSKIKWASGELRANGYDGDRITSNETRTTVGSPAAIRLTSHVSPSGFLASGADIALVDVEIVDANGNRCPTALNVVNFTLSGEAAWRGGIAQGPNNFVLSTSLPVENGVNRIMLRSTTTAGKVSLRATSDDLASTSLELTTLPIQTMYGLSTILPGADLLPELTRGPTPTGQVLSFQRKSLKITSSTAGSGSSPDTSFDDNEESSWVSSSTVVNAWISYRLAKEAEVNQIVVKVRSQRTASYPIRVALDGKSVYTGTIGQNLGYATVSFNATTCSNVTIASTKGALGITEIELYGPVG